MTVTLLPAPRPRSARELQKAPPEITAQRLYLLEKLAAIAKRMLTCEMENGDISRNAERDACRIFELIRHYENLIGDSIDDAEGLVMEK